jgi:hypothetical protein
VEPLQDAGLQQRAGDADRLADVLQLVQPMSPSGPAMKPVKSDTDLRLKPDDIA